MFGIFSKITRRKALSERIVNSEAGVYLYILFPMTVAFLLTFIGARTISHLSPDFFLKIVPGLHVHHFAYGIIVLSVSGYLALVNNGPAATYWIALLHGLGLGLAFDEFGIWLKLTDDSAARWTYDGVAILAGLFLMLISARTGYLALSRLFSKKS
ncbi:MAG TPA: hypothetical protein VG941_01860 [Candidatus Paceibacterota bacterium]|nr:hypothetical protein [Candidatus Paceibacterota bacterium]